MTTHGIYCRRTNKQGMCLASESLESISLVCLPRPPASTPLSDPDFICSHVPCLTSSFKARINNKSRGVGWQ